MDACAAQFFLRLYSPGSQPGNRAGLSNTANAVKMSHTGVLRRPSPRQFEIFVKLTISTNGHVQANTLPTKLSPQTQASTLTKFGVCCRSANICGALGIRCDSHREHLWTMNVSLDLSTLLWEELRGTMPIL